MTQKNEPEKSIIKVSPLIGLQTHGRTNLSTLAVFQINTRIFLLFLFNFKGQLNTTLSQEDQQAQAQTYTHSRKIKLQHSRCGGFQGNCLGTDNKLGEDVVLLNVEN